MSQNDAFYIGPFKYTVVKRDGDFALVSWIESTGIQKEVWINLKRKAA